MSSKSTLLRWRDALDLKVRAEHKAAVITNYQLAVYLVQLVNEGSFGDRLIRMPRRPLDRPMFYEARRWLVERGLLSPDRSLPNTMLRLTDRKDHDPAETLCAIDPFGYLSYLSAMTFHGLTNRLPRVLYFVTPDSATWKSLAAERMAKELGSSEQAFIESDMPMLRHAKLEKLDGMIINEFRTKERGGWRNARDGAIRVTTLGRTFLDMLQRPELCGGLSHVIEVFQEAAPANLASIVSEFEKSGTKIDRVRAGYILEERCRINDARVAAWVRDASRGGSRKLDAQAEYLPVFSERWCLSINA